MKLLGASKNDHDAGRAGTSRLGLTVCLVFIFFLIICGSAGANISTVPVTPTEIVNTTTDNTTAGNTTPIVETTTAITEPITTVIPTITDVIATIFSTPQPIPVITSGIAKEPVAATWSVDPVLQQQFIDKKVMAMHNVTTEQRMQAARDAAAKGLGATPAGSYSVMAAPIPGGTPDYFGPYPNYATSQLPIPLDALGNATPGTGIRKFVDTLPGLTPAGVNNLGQYLPVAVSDTVSYPGSDYYEIAVVQWSEKMHSDIDPTLIRGYVQIESPNQTGSSHIPLYYPNGQPILNASGSQVYAVDNPHYLGPTIVANSNVPVRFKLYNYLPNGTAGNSPIPVDKTLMGAGLGPDGVNYFSENRAVIHLHGGNTPWISDGTPHQWIVPANENTPFMKGAAVVNVPDMDGGTEPNGTQTYYYTNQQSSRLMFYHDHIHGLTRLNVYNGEAAGYVIRDGAEQGLIANATIPSGADEIPLIIQDKSFVPNATQMQSQDPTWNSGNTSKPWPSTGDFWFPHVYMPLQNPADPNNVNAKGRWDYAPWAVQYMIPQNPPIANPYVANGAWEYSKIPATPNPSTVPESFMDTPVVNGVAYPTLQVGPHAYRFRILNAANDRTLNLGFYYAANNGTMWSGTTLLNGTSGEVTMIPALPSPLINASGWPTDNRVGGVPSPDAAGPSWYQIGTEGGFLPAPAVIQARPIDYDYNHATAAVVNIKNHSLLLMPAQRADVIVDFSGIPDGTKLILYNDCPAPSPGGDSRYDYFTGAGDQTAIGGAPDTLAGYGPNTRTVMQVQINSALGSAGPFDLNALNATLPGIYASSQELPLVPQAEYNTAFGAAYPIDYIDQNSNTHTFTPALGGTPSTITLQNKAVIGDFEMVYGRLTALLGEEIRQTPTSPESRVGYQYSDPPTEIFNNSVAGTQIGTTADGTQIWRLSNTDVDLHPVHWHMFNLQVLNRVRWDGEILPPEPNEIGWKETVNVPPLMDTIVAMRPITPDIPWELPNSIRNLDPASPTDSSFQFTGVDPTGGQAPVVNHLVNFGWEYVWHCHILGHEENDFMRAMAVAVPPRIPPSNLTATWIGPNSTPRVNLSWKDNSVSETTWTIQRAPDIAGPWTDLAMVESTTGPATGAFAQYSDTNVATNTLYYYRVLATNWVGDRTTYAWTAGYPTMIVNSTPSVNVTPVVTAGVLASKIGVVNATTGDWWLDYDGTGTWNASDKHYQFGGMGYTPLAADWNGNDKTEIGVVNTGYWWLDYDGSGAWNSNDKAYMFGGMPGYQMISGDWNGDGRAKIGVANSGDWWLDYDGSGTWTATDKHYRFGAAGYQNITGDWNGDGKTEIGTVLGGDWWLDYDGSGNWTVADKHYRFGGADYQMITGDWNGDSKDEIGTVLDGDWWLDYDGSGTWTAADKHYRFGTAGYQMITGDWNSDHKVEIGTVLNGDWWLDSDGTGSWTAGDKHYRFGGMTGYVPILGKWS